MKNKRGAIELSVTTIIVVVIGITLLTLGLIWVQDIFKNLGDISDEAFNRGQTLLQSIEKVDKPLVIIPSTLEVQQNEDEIVAVVIANLETGSKQVDISVNQPAEGDIKCGFLKGRELMAQAPDNPYIISSGDQLELILAIKGSNAELGLTSCDIIVKGDITQRKTLTIDVTPKQGGILG